MTSPAPVQPAVVREATSRPTARLVRDPVELEDRIGAAVLAASVLSDAPEHEW